MLLEHFCTNTKVLNESESENLPPFHFVTYVPVPASELPCPSFTSIYNFMVVRARDCTSASISTDVNLEIQIFKGMDRAVKHFDAGDVQDIKISKIDDKIVYVAAKCLASMKKDKYSVYICLTSEPRCTIHYAYCQCPVGLAQSCSHIGGVLFALNGKERFESREDGLSCTSRLCNWVVPPRSSNQAPRPLSSLNFSKPKLSEESPMKNEIADFDPGHQDDQPIDVSKILHELKDLKEVFPNTGMTHLWNILDEIPNQVHHEETIATNLNRRYEQMEKMVFSSDNIPSMCIEEDLVFLIEKSTRQQRESEMWVKLHKGRITSSLFGYVLKSGDKPISLVKQIVEGSSLNRYTSLPSAVQWGIDHEKEAVADYLLVKQVTGAVKVEETGLTLCNTHTFLGASSDGRVRDFQGEGVLEIKYPFSANNIEIRNMEIPSVIDLNISGFCLEQSMTGPMLKRSHHYYAKVQGEMAIMGLPWCDFVVWTNAKANNIFIEGINFDVEFVKEMMPKLITFYVNFVMPSLLPDI